ncbi:hypothetical protein BB561_000629 [Smittium simulii]|uniref:Kinesin-like protein n=1 Tax=Smittium simulii TaxID=133385 RepID=A0A2T9YY89_9FUNG|nr:hypothetical protein BB561_000629 [Smittium simulii]
MKIKSPAMTITENKVAVICRVRPALNSSPHSPDSITVASQTTINVANHRDPTKQIQYSFDACYGSKATQEEIYSSQVSELVQSVFDGHSATVFCYGVTGAGKTFTIQGNDSHLGIIPRALNQILKKKNSSKGLFEVKMSYYEVFKENIYDLLREVDCGPGLPIREDSNRKTYVAGLREELLSSFDQFKKSYSVAVKRRRTASTKLNTNSSRSHAVLVIKLAMSSASNSAVIYGQLNLIDLAGSEDNRKTDNNRERMKESTAINQSLFVLGKVIEALNSGAKRIPYRDSKMTRILQNSLGGESKSMMIVNIAPEESFLPETHKTLNYATKTKSVINKESIIDHNTNYSSQSTFNSSRSSLLSNKSTYLSSNEIGAKRKRTSQDSLMSASIESYSRKKLSPNQSIHNFAKPISTQENNLLVNRNNHNAKKTEFSKRQELYNRQNHLNIKNDVESIVVEKIQNFEKKTEDMSQMISERLNRLEKKLNSEESFNKTTILDSDILDLISPTTKLKTSKALLVKGKELERSGAIQDALKRYEQALHYAPELKQLAKHIDKLHKKLSNGKPNKSQDSDHKFDTTSLPVNVLLSSNNESHLFSPTNQKHTKNLNNSGKINTEINSNLLLNLNKTDIHKSWKLVTSATKKQKKINLLNINKSLAHSPFKTNVRKLGNNIQQSHLSSNNSYLIQSDDIQSAKKAIKRKISHTKASKLLILDSDAEENSAIHNGTKKSKRYSYDSDDTFNPSSALDSPYSAKNTTKKPENETLNSPTNASILWSINNGNIKSLIKLKGVGKKRAELIRDFISEHGTITNVYDLTKSGLTHSVLTNILASSL